MRTIIETLEWDIGITAGMADGAEASAAEYEDREDDGLGMAEHYRQLVSVYRNDIVNLKMLLHQALLPRLHSCSIDVDNAETNYVQVASAARPYPQDVDCAWRHLKAMKDALEPIKDRVDELEEELGLNDDE